MMYLRVYERVSKRAIMVYLLAVVLVAVLWVGVVVVVHHRGVRPLASQARRVGGDPPVASPLPCLGVVLVEAFLVVQLLALKVVGLLHNQ